LQQVDGLKPSDYLISTANKNINRDITLDEAQTLIEDYLNRFFSNLLLGEKNELKNRDMLVTPAMDALSSG
jgi:transcription initiation factor TFIIIB Brf1 subunit/transcription initiation factor TFIIB